MNVREYFSREGRRVCEEHLSWDKICKQWEKVIDSQDTVSLMKYPEVRLPKQVNLNELLDKTPADRILYVMPGTYGDVFLSTGIVAAIKAKYPTKDIYFATMDAFAPILQGNKDIYKVLSFDGIFYNSVVMNQLFEIVYTPAVETQQSNNWTKNGYGDHLVRVYAKHCGVEPKDPFIQINVWQDRPAEDYVVVHTKTGQEPKNWGRFQKLVDSLDIKVVQVGAAGDPLLKNVIDARGKAIQETAGVIKEAKLFIGGDSVCAHLAGYCKTPSILIYGPTFPELTRYPSSSWKSTCMQPAERFGCSKPCHVAQCFRGQRSCIDNVDIKSVLIEIEKTGIKTKEPPRPTLSGYTTTYNPNKYYPWRQSIKSMLGFCDEVVVVDGGSTDGTLEELKAWQKTEPKLRVFKRKWIMSEPAKDSMQKAYARALCKMDYCWQSDCDEIVHENDYEKIHQILKDFQPEVVKVLTLPVLDLYGSDKTVRTDRGLYKWRISVNDPRITHGIPKQFRKTSPEGKLYCDKNVSDGNDYIDCQSFEVIREQATFMTREIMEAQNNDLPKFKSLMCAAFKALPSVWHFSWNDMVRRINVDLEIKDEEWCVLDNSPTMPENRWFPGVDRATITPEMIKERAEFLKDKHLDGRPMDMIVIDWASKPKVMENN